MSRIISRAENWERAYKALENINFSAFDYNSVKQSLIDYIKLYFPETFNDFIESSEFIAIIEAFAYIAELVAYRLDVNAHENFISTAQRRDSILRLAKLISYTPSRCLPARGLVKITSVRTTESVFDVNGINLANTQIRWNDIGNPDWKDQFILVLNRVLEQPFGTVRPADRFQIQDVVFEMYAFNLNPIRNGVFTYSTTVNGQALPMELVPVEYNPSLGIIERRPRNNSNFTFLYGSDGFGDGSDTTGFFCFTKQGTLQKYTATFDGVTPNQTYDIAVSNINEIDVWVNNINPSTGEILDEPSLLPYRRSTNVKSGEWQPVDLAHAQNVIFNTNPNRNKYEVETRNNDQIRIIFGDGEFADIPAGTFEFWVRSSVNEDIVIPQTAIVNQTQSFTYVDQNGQTQTFTFTFSLISSLQNASASESLERIRAVAPAVYYTQDRMVNAQDYNTFMLQDPSILKLRAVNRTFTGDSKYITWHDPSENYDNVKIFSDDGYLYFEDLSVPQTTSSEVTISDLITLYIEPLISSTDIFLQLTSNGVNPQNIRRSFTPQEITRITTAINTSTPPADIQLYYNKVTFEWHAVITGNDPNVVLAGEGYPADFILYSLINVKQLSTDDPSTVPSLYTITRNARRMYFESPTTRFWNTNDANRVINFSTLNSKYDTVSILKANVDYNRNNLLTQNWDFNVLGIEMIVSGADLGLPNYNRILVMPTDVNSDGIPDNLDPADITSPEGIAQIMYLKYTYPTAPGLIQLPIYFVAGRNDVIVTGTGVSYVEGPGPAAAPINTIQNQINITAGTNIEVIVKEYVYFNRLSLDDPWTITPTTYEAISNWIDDDVNNIGLWKRELGRGEMNFAWLHHTPRYYLVDPSPTNIIDMFIITKGYYDSIKRWLQITNVVQPSPPTPLDLRTSYNYLIDNKMISDTVILHPGRFKVLFGSRAAPELRAKFKVVADPNKNITDNQIKTTIVSVVRNFFDINLWEFGETFYFTELAAAIHAALPTQISSVVLVPVYPANQFGDLFQIRAREDELFYPDISVNDIEIVTNYTPTNLRLTP